MGIIRRAIGERKLRQEPWRAWNAFVDLLVATPHGELDEVQRVAQLVYLYDAGVQNGGHRNYFEQRRDELLEDTQAALRSMDATCQSDILAQAAARWRENPPGPGDSVDGQSPIAPGTEFETLDSAYYKCRPAVQELLEKYLADNFDRFIQVENDT